MDTWTCKERGHCTVEVGHDYALHAFRVEGPRGRHLGKVIPNSIADMELCRQALNAGGCPSCGRWEDGMGETIKSR